MDQSPAVQSRLSPLVPLSLLCSLGSVFACGVASIMAMTVSPRALIVILFLPLLGVAGVVLATLALRQIDRSQGMMVGKGIAVVALFIGLISTILQGATAGSALASAYAVKKNLVPVVNTMFLAAERGDRTACRAALGEGVSKKLSDARLDAFFGTLQQRFGAFQQSNFDLDVLGRASRAIQAHASGIAPGQTTVENPKPMELQFDRGSLIAFIMPDDESMQKSNRIAIGDVLILLDGRDVLCLQEDGPAAALARRLTLNITTIP